MSLLSFSLPRFPCSLCFLGSLLHNFFGVQCPENRFIEGDRCSLIRTCRAGRFEVTAPTPWSNRGCKGCPTGTFQPADDHALPSCRPWSPPCAPGTFETVAPTRSSDRVCQACPSGKYQRLSGQTACQSVTPCRAGEFAVTPATRVRDNACARCDGLSTFQSAPNQAACRPTTTCGAQQYQQAWPTLTTDRKCTVCTQTCPVVPKTK